MINRHVAAFTERQAEQLLRGVERGFDQVAELEIGFELGFVEIIFLLAQLFGVIAPVPRRQAEIAALPGDKVLQCVAFFQCAQPCRSPDIFQQGAGLLWRARHAVGQLEGGEILVPQQGCAFGAQGQHLGDDGVVVVIVGIVAARHPGAVERLAATPVIGILQEGLGAGARQGHRIGRLDLQFRRLRRGGIADRDRNAGHLRLAERQDPVFLVGQDILAELGAQHRKSLGDVRQAVAVFALKLGAGAHEIQVITLQHPQRFVVQAQACALLVHRIQSGEQHGMHGDGAPMRRQARRHLQFNRLQFLVGGRRGEVAEDAVHPREQLPDFLQRHHHIVETGRRRVGRNGGDLGGVFDQGAVIGGAEMRSLDPVQRRGAEGGVPIFKKRVAHVFYISPFNGFPRPPRHRLQRFPRPPQPERCCRPALP